MLSAADPGHAPAPAPMPIGFHADGAIAIDHAEAVLDDDDARLTLWTKPGDQPATLRLHLVHYRPSAASNPSGAVGFGLELDGSAKAVRQEVTANAGANDVTSDLKAAKIDVMAAANPRDPVKPKGKKALRERLVAAGALVPDDKGFRPRWTIDGDLTMRLAAGRGHKVELRYRAQPPVETIARDDLVTAVHWADYCLPDEGAVRFTNQLAPGEARIGRRYVIPVAIDAAHPDSVQLEVRGPKDAQNFIAFCGYKGRGAVNPPGPVAAGVTATGEVKAIVLSAPKPG